MGSGVIQFELAPVGTLPAGVTEAQARTALMNVTTVVHNLSLTPGGATATGVNGAFGRDALLIDETATHYRVLIAGFNGWVAKEGAVHSNNGIPIPVNITVAGRTHAIQVRPVAVFYPFGSYNHGQGRLGVSIPTEINLIEYAEQTLPFLEDDEIVPFSGQTQAQSVSYYVNRGGTLHRILTQNVAATMANRPWGHTVGQAPDWMLPDTPYYSFDGVFFYRNPREIRLDGQGAVNANNPNFSYFQYLSFRARARVSAADLDNFLLNQLDVTQQGQSVMVNSGQHFINAQNTFGTNATLQFAKAIHESNRGLSNIAHNNNNIFGLNAIDSSPGQSANWFPNVQASIDEHANTWMSQGYLYPRDWRYAGPHVGHKGSGMNVRYAMDPYWGEKIAGWAWRIDSASGGRDLNSESFGVLQNNSSVNVTGANGANLYVANTGSFRFFPFLITATEGNRHQILTDGAIENGTLSRTARFNTDSAIGFIPISNLWLKGANPVGTSVSYRTHVQDIGWQNLVRNGQLSGTTGQGLRLEAMEIALSAEIEGGIKYRTHIEDIGWQTWRSNGQISGTISESRRLEAVEIELTGEAANNYDVYYRVHVEHYGWLDWAKNGESAGTAGYGFRAEAIEVFLVEKGERAPGNTTTPFRQLLSHVFYSTHIEDIGWQASVQNGALSGTTAQSKRLEGITIDLLSLEMSGGVRYRTHVQDVGWQNWVADGEVRGTTGNAQRLEAIQIELMGEMNNVYHVYYRVHVEDVGWQNWVRNGEIAGTTGQSLRLEAIEIRLERK